MSDIEYYFLGVITGASIATLALLFILAKISLN
jgi:hypothetical protein